MLAPHNPAFAGRGKPYRNFFEQVLPPRSLLAETAVPASGRNGARVRPLGVSRNLGRRRGTLIALQEDGRSGGPRGEILGRNVVTALASRQRRQLHRLIPISDIDARAQSARRPIWSP